MSHSGRSRLNVRDTSFSPTFGPISINWLTPCNCTLLQFYLTYLSGVPHADDVLTIRMEDQENPLYTAVFKVIPVGANQNQYTVCNDYFELMKDQFFIVTAGNGNNQTVSFEAIFREGG